MSGLLDGTVILSTGGGSGIGRAAIRAFVAEGARVGVLDKFQDKLDELKKAHGDKVTTILGDATTYESNQLATRKTIEAFGRIDTLACFVGVYDVFAGIVDLPGDRISAAFDEIFAVNVKSTVLSVKACLDQLIRNEGRIILSISSSGFISGGGGVLYTASKFAARGLVQELAHELAPKVRVNAVAPGGTISDLRGLAALKQDDLKVCAEMKYLHPPLPYDPSPEIHAPVYVQLASKAFTAAMTGQILRPDGGLDVRGIVKAAGNAEPMSW